MKYSVPFICTSSIAALLTFGLLPAAHAQSTQVYDQANAANVWDLVTPNWDINATWVNGNHATFGGAGETVEVSGAISVGNILFNVSGYTLADANSDATLTLADTSVITVATDGHVATISEAIVAGGIDKQGAGLLVLSGANSYSGNTLISAGQLRVADASALGNTTGMTTVANNATLILADGVTVTGETLTISGTGGASFAGAIQADTNASATWAGPVILGSLDARLGARSGGVLTLSGGIQDGIGTNVTIGTEQSAATPGVVVIAGNNNTYTGATQIIRGVLRLGATDALPTTTALNVDTTAAVEDAVFDLNGFNQTVSKLERGSIGGTGGSIVTNTGAATSTLTVNATTDHTFAGTIIDGTAPVALTKTGASMFTLAGTNDYSGATTISTGNLRLTGALNDTAITANGGTFTAAATGTIGGAASITITSGASTLAGVNTYTGETVVGTTGILTLSNDDALGSAAGVSRVLSGGRIVLSDGIVIEDETIFIAGTGTNNNGALQAAAGATAEWGGSIVTAGDTRLGGDTGGTLIVSGVISGVHAILFSRGTNSTTLLSGVNTYTGDTQIFANSGTRAVLRIGIDHAISAASRLSAISAITTVDATLDLNGFDLALRSLSTSAQHASGAKISVGNDADGTTSVLTLSDPAAATVETFTGTLRNDVSGTGVLALVKNGAYRQILAGNNTYSGSTTVNAGVLQIGGSVNSFGSTAALDSTELILNGGALDLNNRGTANNSTDRLLDTATVNLRGGAFVLSGSELAATDSSERVGDLLLGIGLSRITASFGGTNVATLSAAGFTRPANGGSALVNGVNLGRDSTSTASVARILLDTAPTLIGTTAALPTGINAGVRNTRIVPFLLGAVDPAPGGLGTASTTANTFVTYDPGTGLRPLNLTDEFTQNAFIAGDNIRLTATTGVASSVTVNSLILEGGSVNIASGQTLTVDSGAILLSAGIDLGINGGTLAFGNREGLVTINSGGLNYIRSIITGTAGVSYYGTGTLVLATQQNTYSGPTLLSVGTVIPQTSSQGPAGAPTSGPFGTGTVILGGSALRATSSTAVTIGNVLSFAADTRIISGGESLTFTGPVTLAGGDRTLRQDSSSAATFSGAIGDAGQDLGLTITGTGSGPVVLSGDSTYTGDTNVRSGTLLVSGSLSASSAVQIGDAANLTTPAILAGGGTVGDVTVGAAVGNTGAILRPGATSTSNSTGTTLNTGALAFADSAARLSLRLGRTTAFSPGGGDGTAGGDVSDHVRTAGVATFNGANLELSLLTGTGYTPGLGDLFYLIINDSPGALNGTFAALNGTATDLSEGATFDLGGQFYAITYLADFGGNTFTGGNDAALMAVVPEPGTVATLLGGVACLLGMQRMRRRQRHAGAAPETARTEN